jgi:hypothetical protein
MVRELVTWPISAARAAIDLPRSMRRSIREANELMEVSREQLDVMRRQADQALEQAERMNQLLARVVKLTEPLERAQRGGEYVGERLKKALFGDGPPGEAAIEEAALEDVVIEEAAIEAEIVAEEAEQALNEADEPAEESDVIRGGSGEEPPASSR